MSRTVAGQTGLYIIGVAQRHLKHRTPEVVVGGVLRSSQINRRCRCCFQMSRTASWTGTGLNNIIRSSSDGHLKQVNSRGIRTQVGVGVADTDYQLRSSQINRRCRCCFQMSRTQWWGFFWCWCGLWGGWLDKYRSQQYYQEQLQTGT
ncbi:Hypothetical_protein [Hexamita inflata]|uniref:Hypothetical_protein n=1 Tax=Hexamita inflata TaxID=28002 RepID=A0ABP1GI56_9EUKA